MKKGSELLDSMGDGWKTFYNEGEEKMVWFNYIFFTFLVGYVLLWLGGNFKYGIRRELDFHANYDHTHIINHLEKRAREGWLLEKMNAFGYSFRRIAPQEVHFAIAYGQQVEIDSPDWRLLVAGKDIEIFASVQEKASPLPRNRLEDVEALHKAFFSFLKVAFPIWLWFLLICVGGLAIFGRRGSGMALTDPFVLFTIGVVIVPLISLLVSLFIHYRWYNKARLLVEEGILLATKDTAWLNKGLWLIIAVCYVAGILFYVE